VLPHICLFIGMNVAGRIADTLIIRGIAITRVRKIMQSIGFGAPMLVFMVVGGVESAPMAIGILCVGVSFGAFAVGGFLVNHMDIAPRHAVKLMGITNTAGSISGVIGVYLSGYILQATNSWLLVFQVAAGVTFLGLVVYLLFASSEKIYE